MAARQGPPGSLAARVTYLLEPKNWLIVTVVGVGAVLAAITLVWKISIHCAYRR